MDTETEELMSPRLDGSISVSLRKGVLNRKADSYKFTSRNGLVIDLGY